MSELKDEKDIDFAKKILQLVKDDQKNAKPKGAPALAEEIKKLIDREVTK